MNSTENHVVNGHVPVYDHASHQAKMDQIEHDEIRVLSTMVGALAGSFITIIYVNTGKSVIPRADVAPVTGAITGFCIGELFFHGRGLTCGAYRKVKEVKENVSRFLSQSIGLNLPSEESALVKTCVSLGALSNIIINRELMLVLLGLECPPAIRPSQLGTEAMKELVNTSVLAVTGAGIGYVTGKGIECGARAVCNGVNLASRGIQACINAVRAWSGNGQNVAESAHPPEEVPSGTVL